MIYYQLLTSAKALRKFINILTISSWGIFKQFIEIIRNQADGTFILMKTLSGPKPIVKLLKTTENELLEAEEGDF